MIYSVIEIETWKRCRRKWDLTSDNRQNLEAIRHASALVLGSLVHETLAEKTFQVDLPIKKRFADKAAQLLDQVEATYKAAIGTGLSIEEEQPLYEAMSLGVAMLEAYESFYASPLPDHYKPVRTEQRMIVPIPNTEHWECDNCHSCTPIGWFAAEVPNLGTCPKCSATNAVTWQLHHLRGTMDTLVQDVMTGLLYNLERKTYMVRPRIDKLQNDTQMIAYEWMLSQLFGRENVGGTLYDGIWKRNPNTKYFKSHYTIDDLFLRRRFIHPPEQLEEFGYYLPTIVNEMATARPQDLYYNRRWEGCFDCGMKELCDAMSRGEDVDYIRDTFYRQRTDPNQLADPDVASANA